MSIKDRVPGTDFPPPATPAPVVEPTPEAPPAPDPTPEAPKAPVPTPQPHPAHKKHDHTKGKH
jgi:hypothetical protein